MFASFYEDIKDTLLINDIIFFRDATLPELRNLSDYICEHLDKNNHEGEHEEKEGEMVGLPASTSKSLAQKRKIECIEEFSKKR
ncbi:unnamed protein product [Rhizophagus irregularis]|nr:unnamed protein product [Rhizophagus irregularis]